MFVFTRIVVTIAYLWFVVDRAKQLGPEIPILEGTWILVQLVVFGLITSAFWVPVIGEKASGPLTSLYTEDTSVRSDSVTMRLIQKLQTAGFHRLAILVCLWERFRHPHLPYATLAGLRSARPGSFLEKIMAKELFRSHHVAHALRGYQILVERHNIRPKRHANPEVVLALRGYARPTIPNRNPLAMATNVPPPMYRNSSIALPEIPNEASAQGESSPPTNPEQ